MHSQQVSHTDIPQKKFKHCCNMFYEGNTLALACYENINHDGTPCKSPKLLSYKARELAMLTLTCPSCTINMDAQYVAEQLLNQMHKKFRITLKKKKGKK